MNAPQEKPSAPRRSSLARLLRRISWTAGGLLLLLILALVGVWFGLRHRMRTSLAPLDGTLHLPGLSAPVTVRRDALGVPHIEAANLGDLLAAQGWVTASDRLWQMDMARRLPAGEAAEVLGPALVDHDRVERTLRIRDVAERMVSTMPAEQMAGLEAYARGVNAYIANGVLPAEFSLLLYKPRPWRPVDSVLVALSMAELLDERWQAKLKREQVTTRLASHGESALAADLYPTGSWRDHPPVPSAPGISDPQEVPQVPLDPSQTRLRLDSDPSQTRLRPDSDPSQTRLRLDSDPSQTRLRLDSDPSQTRLKAVPDNAGGLLALARIGEGGACAGCRPGSNEWAVTGAHTASGHPLLSNDMHLEHAIPDLWYETELHAGALHVAGVTVPGLPWIAAGHNDHIAWGFTALGADTQDIYIEQTDGRGQYRARGGDGVERWIPFSHEQETIHVRGGKDVQLDVLRTVHGPVITPILQAQLGSASAGGERRTLSLHWAIYDDAAQGLPLLALDQAGDWTSFRVALKNWWAPTLNVAYADDAGHIGYQAVGLIPVRAGGLQALPVQAGLLAPPPAEAAPKPQFDSGVSATGEAPQPPANALQGQAVQDNATPPFKPDATPLAKPIVPPTEPNGLPWLLGEWTGTIPFPALPSVLDPPGGIVATANARVTPDGYPYQVTLEWAAPYRNERIWKWLTGKQGLTPADMLKLQTDVYSEVDQEIGQRLAYAVDHAPQASARARQAADLLRSWDGVLAVNSAAAAIVTEAERRFWPEVLGAKIGEGWRLYDWSESTYAREQLIAHGPAAWLPPGSASWNAFLASLVEASVKQGPGRLASWRYGQIHTIQLQHPLWKLMPFLRSGVGPLPQSGDQTTVKQVSGNLGPSQRFTADLGNLDGSTENIVMGESGDPLSPYFRDQWPLWYSGTTANLPFSPQAVAAAAQHTLQLVP